MVVLSVLMENLDVPQIVLTTVVNGLAMDHVNKNVGPTSKSGHSEIEIYYAYVIIFFT